MGDRISDEYNPPYDAPTPRRFYVHDDLTAEVLRTHGANSEAHRFTVRLFDRLRKDEHRVVVLTVDEQIESLIRKAGHRAFEITVGIGSAGELVAQQVHERTGWFPNVQRVDVTREEDGRGGYNLVSTVEESLEQQLRGLKHSESVAVVDDTVFSGLTMRSVLASLPDGVLARTHAFCLRCVEESLSSVQPLCPITAGLSAPGRIFEDVSFINASGLVKRVGIRRDGRQPLAFFERRQWMDAWFPGYADEVIDLCRSLNGLLES